MPKLAAGILLYRKQNKKLEVFLVHPGGPFWAKKDAAAWSIPKGEYTDDEDPWAAAQREFAEETGQPAPTAEAQPLGEVKYGNKKLVAWAVEGDIDATRVLSNTITIEWPPKSGNVQAFPEVDRAGWFTLTQAQQKLVKGQVPLVEMLANLLHVTVGEPPAALTSSDQLALL